MSERRIKNPLLNWLVMIAAIPVLLVLLVAHHAGMWLDKRAGQAFDWLARFFGHDG